MKHCSTISAQGNSTKHYPQFLERHLKSTEDDDFSGDDPLYVLSQGPDYPIRVASSDESLRFFNDLRKGCGLRRLKDEEEFPRAIFSHDRILFPHKRNDCRYIYLMTRQQYPEPLGFMVLDNPHPHFVKLDRNMEITELLCNLFAGYLEGRGLGVAGWYERETLRRSAIDGSQSQLIAITNNILQLAATAPHEFSHDQQ